MRVPNLFILLVALSCGWFVTPSLAAAPDSGSAVTRGARHAGHAVAEGARKGGHAVAEGARKGGHAVARGARKGGHAVAEGARKGGHAVAEGARAAGRWVSGPFRRDAQPAPRGGSTHRSAPAPADSSHGAHHR